MKNNKYIKQNVTGFTIVELLVVIVVIGILAAITIISYSGISQRAAEASLKSDISNSIVQIGIDYTLNGAYPSSLAAANEGKGLSASQNTNYFYNHDYNSYCLSAASALSGVDTFHVSSNTGSLVAGDCNYNTTLLQDLTAYWKLDETSGTVARDSMGSYDGVISPNGTTLNQTGKIDKSYNFNKSVSWGLIEVPPIALDGTPFSISYWQKSTYIDTAGNPGVIASRDATTRNFNVINRVNGKLVSFRTWDESGGSDTLDSVMGINDDWHFVVCTVTGTKKQIYIDGVLDREISWVHYLKPDPNGIKIAAAVNNGTFNGLLDEIGIWKRALSESEIQALYNSGAGLQYP